MPALADMLTLNALPPFVTLELTASRDQNFTSLSFKSASLDQLWSCLQRCLLFEEPSNRWNKLLTQVARHQNGKNKD
ncbi:MAG: hypothetical protein K2X27_10880, partial [Candidatus Obscuribacterales bacterium]|nr:hypothetical protein [Candidatus Obscuribacterales bacterium]